MTRLRHRSTPMEVPCRSAAGGRSGMARRVHVPAPASQAGGLTAGPRFTGVPEITGHALKDLVLGRVGEPTALRHSWSAGCDAPYPASLWMLAVLDARIACEGE